MCEVKPRTCPVGGCRRSLDSWVVMCDHHWARVCQELRRVICSRHGSERRTAIASAIGLIECDEE